MNTRPQLDDPEMAIRYLSGKLSAAENEAFEEHYLAHPTVVEEMELDAKFKAGLIGIRDSGELAQLRAASTRVWPRLPLAIAASILLAVITVFSLRYLVAAPVLALSTAELRRPLAAQPLLAATYKLIPNRGSLYDAVISLPEGSQAIKLQVVADIEPPIPQLVVALVAVADDASRRELAALRHLLADENGTLTLYLNSAALKPGIHELLVSRDAGPAADPERTFILNVTPR